MSDEAISILYLSPRSESEEGVDYSVPGRGVMTFSQAADLQKFYPNDLEMLEDYTHAAGYELMIDEASRAAFKEILSGFRRFAFDEAAESLRKTALEVEHGDDTLGYMLLHAFFRKDPSDVLSGFERFPGEVEEIGFMDDDSRAMTALRGFGKDRLFPGEGSYVLMSEEEKAGVIYVLAQNMQDRTVFDSRDFLDTAERMFSGSDYLPRVGDLLIDSSRDGFGSEELYRRSYEIASEMGSLDDRIN